MIDSIENNSSIFRIRYGGVLDCYPRRIGRRRHVYGTKPVALRHFNSVDCKISFVRCGYNSSVSSWINSSLYLTRIGGVWVFRLTGIKYVIRPKPFLVCITGGFIANLSPNVLSKNTTAWFGISIRFPVIACIVGPLSYKGISFQYGRTPRAIRTEGDRTPCRPRRRHCHCSAKDTLR